MEFKTYNVRSFILETSNTCLLMNYDTVIENWIDKVNTLFRTIDNMNYEEHNSSPSYMTYIQNHYNKLSIGSLLLRMMNERSNIKSIKEEINKISIQYNNPIISTTLNKIIETARLQKNIFNRYFYNYYLSSVIFGIYNDKGITCKEYNALSAFLFEECNNYSVIYIGDMAMLSPLFPISRNHGYISFDNFHEEKLCEQIINYTHNNNLTISKYLELNTLSTDCIFINMLYCSLWEKERIKQYTAFIRSSINNNLKYIYVITSLNDILENKLLKCIGISLNSNFKIKIINILNDKCIVCIDLMSQDDFLEYKVYNFQFDNLYIDYSKISDIRKNLYLAEDLKIKKQELLEKFYTYKIKDKQNTKNFKRYYLYNLITQRPDIRKSTDIRNIAFYNIELGKRVTHKYDNNILYSFHKTTCTAKDFTTISVVGRPYDNGSIRYIDEPVLIINKKYYLPTFFNPVNGPILIDINENYLYSVKDIISPDYLVNELNKPAFIMKYVNNTWNNQLLFLQSNIYLPISENSLERQKQIYRYDKQIYINRLIKDFDIEISYTYNTSSSDLPKGTALYGGKYIIDSKIGEGGFSKTYKAIKLSDRDNSGIIMSTKVVIKEFFIKKFHHRIGKHVEVVMGEDTTMAKKALEKFWDEANKISKLKNCSNIISIYDVFDENGTCYYSMEYIEGNDLAYYCESTPNKYLPSKEAISIIMEVCNAVKAMHDIRMNHFDIKPENILIDSNGHVKLIDFGTACQFVYNDGNSTVLPIISQGYSPIELLSNITSFSPQSDIYSIGATLYNILTGNEVPSSVMLSRDFKLLKKTDNINTQLWKAIVKSMDPDINKRPSSINDLIRLIT